MTKISEYSQELLTERIRKTENFLIITHQNPDGDAIGSSLGLFHALKNIGKEAKIIVPNDFPAFLKWMPASEKIIVYERNKTLVNKLFLEKPFIFYLDLNEFSRVGKLQELLVKSEGFSLLIDHHPDPGKFTDIVMSDISVSSTSELVFNFIKEFIGLETIDKQAAECLYAGIMTDTGSFSFNSSNPETYGIVSVLLSLGIDKDFIYNKVYDNFSKDRLKLLGYCLDQKMVVLDEYDTAYISLTNSEKLNYKFQPGDSEGFVNYPLSIRNVVLSAFFMENGKKVKISFRSKGDFPVNHFAAKYFQGGGHKNASGGESHITLEKTIEKFINLLPEYIDDFKNGKIC